MNDDNRKNRAASTADVLLSMRRKGVRVWADGDRLRFKAPKGAVTQVELDRLLTSKAELVALLEQAPGCEEQLRSGHIHWAPLTLSQLARWRTYELGERRVPRSVASVTRLYGALDVDALQRSIVETVRRHEALRTNIVTSRGVPAQEIIAARDARLPLDDLTGLADRTRKVAEERSITAHLLDIVDVAVDPLFAPRLFKVAADEHVLIIALEHMISDAVSLAILFRDLFSAYAQASCGIAFSLPPVPVQFADYAVRQRAAEESWVKSHGTYWKERLGGCNRLCLPRDQSAMQATRVGWGSVPLVIAPELKSQVREWSRIRRTTLVLSVFTAYVALILRWCGTHEAVIQFQTDGRDSDVQDTIGYFAAVLYLKLELRDHDSFVDLLNRVSNEYCGACAHADFAYLASREPKPAFARNPGFNWVPQTSTAVSAGSNGGHSGLSYLSVPFVHPMLDTLALDHEPSVLLFETADQVVGRVNYPRRHFHRRTMERFARSFVALVQAMVREPDGWVKRCALPRDADAAQVV